MSRRPPPVVVLTGASSGIGRATARKLAGRSAAIALVARGRDALAATADEVRAAGARALPLPLDVADAAAVDAAADRVESELGPIDVWINCHMTAVLAPLAETGADEIRRVAEVTYLGAVHGTMSALRRMRPRDRGTIVQVGSALAYRGIPLQASYCAAKHAVKGFTESVRCELRHDGSRVHVTMVQLPGVNTPQFVQVKTTLARRPRPVAPVYAPEAAADAIVWASEHRRREVWVGRSTALTIVGNALAPGLVERYLARTAYDGQMSDDPMPPGAPDYLWGPLPGDPGAEGPYRDEAIPASALFRASKHRRAAWAAAAAGAVAAAAWRRRA